MAPPTRPSDLRRRPSRLPILPVALVLLLVGSGMALAAPTGSRGVPGTFHPLSGSTTVTLTATNALNFAPSAISIPTLSVEIEIENVATTDHTFTLSSRVNQTAPSGANASNTSGSWFDPAHVAADYIVLQGKTIFVNVTLATAGTYEFICRYHYPTMIGELTVGAPPSSSSSNTPIYLYAGAGIAVVAVIVIAIVLLRRRPAAPAGPATPPS